MIALTNKRPIEKRSRPKQLMQCLEFCRTPFFSVGRPWPRFVVKTIAWALAFVLQQVDNLTCEKNES